MTDVVPWVGLLETARFGEERGVLRERIGEFSSFVRSAGTPAVDHFAGAGLLLSFDESDRLNFIEATAASGVSYSGVTIVGRPFGEILADLRDLGVGVALDESGCALPQYGIGLYTPAPDEMDIDVEGVALHPDNARLWPHYSLVTIPVVGGADVLDEITVPRELIGGEYRALPQATPVDRDGMRHLIAFGESGLEGLICLDTHTQAVVQVPCRTQPGVNAVNASLDLFRRCVEAAIRRFPFHSREDEDDDAAERVSTALGAELRALDPTTDELKGFWETFLDDLTMGNYVTEDLLGVE